MQLPNQRSSSRASSPVDWLRRTGRAPPSEAPVVAPAAPQSIEGAAPGLAALLDGVSEDRSHAILDLGPATDRSLQIYSRFARCIRFADLIGNAWPHDAGSTARSPTTLLPRLDRRYDLVFGWDILDRLFPDDRPLLVDWLAESTPPDARLHLVVRTFEHAIIDSASLRPARPRPDLLRAHRHRTTATIQAAARRCGEGARALPHRARLYPEIRVPRVRGAATITGRSPVRGQHGERRQWSGSKTPDSRFFRTLSQLKQRPFMAM